MYEIREKLKERLEELIYKDKEYQEALDKMSGFKGAEDMMLTALNWLTEEIQNHKAS